MTKKTLIIFLLFSILTKLPAQNDQSSLDIAAIVFMDSLVVSAARQGFDVEDFIQLVVEDESFYRAFKNLRFLSYSSDSEIFLFDKKGKKDATYSSEIVQEYDGECRSMKVLKEEASDKFFKKKKAYRYYTAKLYDRLFYTHGRVCEKKDYHLNTNEKQLKGMEKHINQLKRLIFQPGKEVNVPVIGKKTALFDQKLSKYYNYSITSKTYKGGTDCYVFSAIVRPEFVTKKEGKTVIKHLETYFDKNNFQVVARDYQLEYSSAAFDFDVTMDIKLTKIGGKYVPEYIKYDGFWNVPLKKPEIAQFTVNFYDFQ